MIDLLVIEPSLGARKTLERMLEPHGYRMRGVTRSAEALQQIGRQRPDLILSEVQLPGGDGLDLCQQLWLAGLPVLLMSSEPTEQLRQDCREAGALELLDKPVSERDLLRSLTQHLRLSRPPPQPRVQPRPTLLGSLMTRPGMLGAALVDARGEVLEQTGQTVPAVLYLPFLGVHVGGEITTGGEIAGATVADAAGSASVDLTTDPTAEQPRCLPADQPPLLQSAQLDYPSHCLLLLRLPGERQTVLVCLIQNSSYASLIRYHLRSSPHVRL